ncbi:MAG TPA: hypothetical protein VF949_14620 [Reyranella sp.]|jgi:streptomycin 6-kinase
MKAADLQIPDRVRRRALAVGEAGVAWLDGLDGLVGDLATEWQLSIGRTLSGETEALVAETTTAEGHDAVLKIAIPGLDPTASELRTLLAAQGRGYAAVFRHDAARGAMLLERLGPRSTNSACRSTHRSKPSAPRCWTPGPRCPRGPGS